MGSDWRSQFCPWNILFVDRKWFVLTRFCAWLLLDRLCAITLMFMIFWLFSKKNYLTLGFSRTTSVKKMSRWHITMTYSHDDISRWHMVLITYVRDDISWYVIMICHHDMSSRTSWNPAMTCNDICNDILRWHILMTPPSMTYLMTYCGNSTPWGH